MFLSCSSEDQNQLIVALDVESLVRVSELTTFRLTVVISLLPQHTFVFCSTQLQDGMGDIHYTKSFRGSFYVIIWRFNIQISYTVLGHF